jgi:hypothetical protein
VVGKQSKKTMQVSDITKVYFLFSDALEECFHLLHLRRQHHALYCRLAGAQNVTTSLQGVEVKSQGLPLCDNRIALN